MKLVRSTHTTFCIGLALLLVACGTGTVSNLVKALNIVVDATIGAKVVIPILQANGLIPPAEADAALTYTTSVMGAAQSSIMELGTMDTSLVKISKIVPLWTSIVVPKFSGQIGAIIAGVQALVEVFLHQLQGPATVAARAAPTAPIVVTGADKATLSAIEKKIAANR